MLVEMILLMYKGTAAFAIRNLEMSLNSAFYGMKLVEKCGFSNIINIGIIDVWRHHCFCLNENKKNTKYRFLRYEFSEDVRRQRC